MPRWSDCAHGRCLNDSYRDCSREISFHALAMTHWMPGFRISLLARFGCGSTSRAKFLLPHTIADLKNCMRNKVALVPVSMVMVGVRERARPESQSPVTANALQPAS
ncbi:hypothetical protein J6590_050619 [Homalodisca vitripennis]|nr:hypothetical protein J6590_050619 [Homalodisca vitripennis]